MSRVARVVLGALLIGSGPIAAQNGAVLSIDQLQSVNSLVGGTDAPLWRPDGSGIVFIGGVDGGLWNISPEGGFPTRVSAGIVGGVIARATAQLQ